MHEVYVLSDLNRETLMQKALTFILALLCGAAVATAAGWSIVWTFGVPGPSSSDSSEQLFSALRLGVGFFLFSGTILMLGLSIHKWFYGWRPTLGSFLLSGGVVSLFFVSFVGVLAIMKDRSSFEAVVVVGGLCSLLTFFPAGVVVRMVFHRLSPAD